MTCINVCNVCNRMKTWDARMLMTQTVFTLCLQRLTGGKKQIQLPFPW